MNLIYCTYTEVCLKTGYTKLLTIDHHFAIYVLMKCQFWIILRMSLPVPIAYFVYTPRKRHPLMTWRLL